MNMKKSSPIGPTTSAAWDGPISRGLTVQVEMKIEDLTITEHGTFILTVPTKDFKPVDLPHEQVAALCNALHEQGHDTRDIDDAVEALAQVLQTRSLNRLFAKRTTVMSVA
jgi:hypothetical protein